MNELLGRAEIDADFVPVVPGDQLITDVAIANLDSAEDLVEHSAEDLVENLDPAV
jgi:hypothetical protein